MTLTPDVDEFLTLFAGGGWDDATIVRGLAIGYAESGAKKGAIGGPNRDGTYDYGFMQVNSVHFAEHEFVKQGWNAQTMLQIAPNLSASRFLSNQWKNWTPWSTFKNGRYLDYVPQAKADLAAWKQKHHATGNVFTDVPGAVGSAASNVGSNVLNGLVNWLNPFTKTAGIAALGGLLLILGIVVIVASSKAVRKAAVGAVVP